jgi:hypothetical protein
MIINPYIFGQPLLLDTYSGAAVAYSVRKLRTAYSGAAIRVRRSSDNAEQDIYFDSTGNLDTASLQNFVGYQNYIYYSEQFQNAYWTKTNTAISADATTDPIGGTTADKLQENTTNGYHNVSTLGFTATVNNYYTYSVYLKSSERTFCNITLSDNATGEVYVVVDLSNGTIGSALGTGNWTNRSAAITNIGNGWYRVSVTAQKTVATVTNAVVNISLMQNSTTFIYAGTTGNGIFIWGAQLVDGILPGTYQQTTNVNNTANGFVTRWYDQSGNANDITQTTAINQPQIVNSGNVILQGTKPAFTGNGNGFVSTSAIFAIGNANYTTFHVLNPSANAVNRNIYSQGIGTNGRNVVFTKSNINQAKHWWWGSDFNSTLPFITYNISSTAWDGTLRHTTVNTINQTDTPIVIKNTATGIASIFFIIGTMQEFIVYNSNEIANRTAITTNINSYYSIYSSGPIWDGSQSGMLNTYSGAAVAYSVRALNSAYTGPLIRVRRSSDNTEIDIFALYNGELDTTFLLNFTGVGNGFVTTWYDQSGNARNATNTTAANQPQIVSSGSILQINSKPALTFDGTNDSFNLSSFAYNTTSYHSFVGKRDLSGRRLFALGGLNNHYLLSLWTDNFYYLQANTTGYQKSTGIDTSTNQLLITGLRNISGMEIYKNNTVVSSAFQAITIGGSISTIGLWGTQYLFGSLQEIVYYNNDQSTNRTGINTNIQTYFGI